MRKTLTVSIDDTSKDGSISLSVTRDETKPVPIVVVRIGQEAIPLNSKELAEALKAVVNFGITPQIKSDEVQTFSISEKIS